MFENTRIYTIDYLKALFLFIWLQEHKSVGSNVPRDLSNFNISLC